jgi:hypothetical protein
MQNVLNATQLLGSNPQGLQGNQPGALTALAGLMPNMAAR